MITHFALNSNISLQGHQHQQQHPTLTIPERGITKVSNKSFIDNKSSNSSLLSMKDELIENCNIRDNDILCGRGLGAKTNIGNVMFRSLVRECQHIYLSSKPFEKANIAKEIVSKIRNSGGRFLKRHYLSDTQSTLWHLMDDKAAREKTCQALRERVPFPNGAMKGKMTIKIPTVGDSDSMNIVVNEKDVLLGRGGVTNTHLGNKKYRSLVRELQQEYFHAPKLKKSDIALRVVNQVYSEGGRFLVENEGGNWEEVSKERARKKTSQTMREKAPQLRHTTKV